MKRGYFSLILCAIFLIGCGNKSANPVTSAQPDQKFSVAKSATVTRESSIASNDDISKQAESINKFAIGMYNKCKQEGKSLFLSPYSITEALAMTAAGADSNTLKQIRDALQVTLEGDTFDQAINAIDQSLTAHAAATDGLTLNIVNSTWMQSGWDFKVSYLDHLAKYYGAGVNLMDFLNKPEECRQIINTWVSDLTNNKILNLLPEGSILPATRLVLTNAIYFLGNWLYSFDPQNTKNQDFTLLDKSKISVPTMALNKANEKVTMRYARGKGVRALDFPYKGDRLAMTVLLPDLDSFTTVENSLSTAMLNQLISALKPESLAVSLPKFRFTCEVPLKEQLMALGMTDAFNPDKADFSGIDGTKSLSISEIYHKAYISVDEKGTEAAAATAVVFVESSIKEAPVIFVVDRPFIFAIRDKETGTILFMGRILNPLQTE